jgi:hypothetical protein
VAVQVASTTLETITHLEGKYGLRGSFKEEVQGPWQSLSSTYTRIPVGSVPGSPVAEVLGNKFVILGDPLLPMFIYTIYIFISG